MKLLNTPRIVLLILAVILIAAWQLPIAQEEPPMSNAEKAEQSELCLACHEDYDVSLEGTVHQLSSEVRSASISQIACIDCHSGWREHVDDPTAENIVAGNEAAASMQAALCASCHQTAHQTAMVTTDPHARADLACADCHSIHNNPAEHLTKDDGANYCLACHSNVMAEFKIRSSHPLEAGFTECVDCHNLGKIQDPMLAAGLDWRCQSCHSEVAGPFPFEHPVTNEHLVNGDGCVECHQPHGSPNDRLLNQPGDMLCASCHGVPPGHQTAHGGLGASLACVECHSDIHGSTHNSLFLDPNLNMKLAADCYSSGCHAGAVGR